MTITNSQINEIIKKYNIGKRPLSIILGLGEITISRYLNNESKPNNQISELLLEILNDPSKYLEYLEKNKSKISSIAFGKSKTAVSKLLNLSNEKDIELENVAQYIINNNEITNLSLQKLLYYCQLFNYVIYDKPMFKSACSAWDHGPVYDDIYYKYKINGNNPISDINKVDLNFNKKLVNAIINNFGIFSGPTLCYFTHSENPWKTAYNNGGKINDEAFKKFFFHVLKSPIEKVFVVDAVFLD